MIFLLFAGRFRSLSGVTWAREVVKIVDLALSALVVILDVWIDIQVGCKVTESRSSPWRLIRAVHAVRMDPV